MDARIEALVPDLEAEIARRHEGLRRARPRHRHRQRRPARLRQGLRRRAARAARRSTPDTVFQIGSTTKAFLAHDARDRRRPRALRAGTTGWSTSIRSFQLKDPWVTQEFRALRPPRPALGPAALRQRHRRPARRRPAGDDPLAARRRAGVELPLDLRLYQHHPHGRGARSSPRRSARRTGRRWRGRRSSSRSGMSRHLLHRRGDRGGAGHARSATATTPRGPVEVPFTPIFPYGFAGAGAINSTVDDLVPLGAAAPRRRHASTARSWSRRRTSRSPRPRGSA